MSWAAHAHPSQIFDMLRPLPAPPVIRMRMTYFDANAPGTTGYTIVTNGFKLYAIHAHQDDGGHQFYEDNAYPVQGTMWLYMPMDPGERLVEICGQYGAHPGQVHYISLMVRTSGVSGASQHIARWLR